MSDIIFKPFKQQKDFLLSRARIRGAWAGRRGGKSEAGAIAAVMLQEQKPNIANQGRDPYLGVLICPTHHMLTRLAWKKFCIYAKPFIKHQTKSPLHITWHDGSEVIGISADRPERLEGVKANWILIDEAAQVSEQLFLECKARTADTQGYIICTGSLGVNIVNPKSTWVYKYFKENPDKNTECFEWATVDNPYFPKDEIESLRASLDPRTYRSLFTVDWDVVPQSAVYPDFSDANKIKGYQYDPSLETYVSIDWGWTHPVACLFFQYDRKNDRVFLFDEIIGSNILLETLYQRIIDKRYKIKSWICDIAGNQEREQTGRSNCAWFEERGVFFKYRRTAIQYGLPIVRSYIKDGLGRTKFFVDEARCPRSVDGITRYRYPEKDGIIANENPIKENDDVCDSIRYFYVNILDKRFSSEGEQILIY